MIINAKKQPWCYWLRQGAMGQDDLEKRTWDFAFRKGVIVLCHELGWNGGTIHQVIAELKTATYANS